MKMIKRSVLILVLTLVFILGCAPREVEQIVMPDSKRAQIAWENKDWNKARTIYERLLSVSEDKSYVLKRLVFCCLMQGDLDGAEKYLDLWQKWYPDAKESWEWCESYFLFLEKREGFEKALEFLKSLITQNYRQGIRVKALRYSVKRLLKRSHEEFFEFFEELYAGIELPAKRERFVREFLKESGLSYEQIADLLILIPQDKDPFEVPYCLIKWQKLVMDLKHSAVTWPYAWSKLLTFIRNSDSCVKTVFNNEFKSLIKSFGPLQIKIGLLLPLGRVTIGWKILKGAELAQLELMSEGMNVELEVINTLNGTWSSEVLNSNCVLYGGVLRKSVWEVVSDQEAFEHRIFFVFRSIDKREKKNIFSFFPTYKDQISCVVKFLADEFGINKFAVFAPESEFGIKMANSFTEVVNEFGYDLIKKGFYYPRKHAIWKYQVAKFLDIPEEYFKHEEFDKEFALIEPEFQAVFLPDSFEEAKILIPEFFFFDVNNIFFIGPVLWSFENTKVSRIDSIFYKLAIYPSPWDLTKDRLEGKLKEFYFDSASDFWVGLGYDFVRFVVCMMTSILKVTPEDVKDYLNAEAFLFDWTIEPIKWDKNGESSESMILFQPSVRGPKKVSKHRLEIILSRIKKEEKEKVNEDNQK